jgi:hypothetical protein
MADIAGYWPQTTRPVRARVFLQTRAARHITGRGSPRDVARREPKQRHHWDSWSCTIRRAAAINLAM